MCAGLLEQKLIACANILPPHKAMYVWDGMVQNHENECAVIMKSTDEKFSAIETYVVDHHDYEVPCLVQMEITGGHNPFLEWVKGAVQ